MLFDTLTLLNVLNLSIINKNMRMHTQLTKNIALLHSQGAVEPLTHLYHSNLAAEFMLSSQGNAPGLFHLGLTQKARDWFDMQRAFTMSRFHTTLWLPSAIPVTKIKFHFVCPVEQQRIPSDPFPHDRIHPTPHCKHPALAKGTQVWELSCTASTCSSSWDWEQKPGKENKILGF